MVVNTLKDIKGRTVVWQRYLEIPFVEQRTKSQLQRVGVQRAGPPEPRPTHHHGLQVKLDPYTLCIVSSVRKLV